MTKIKLSILLIFCLRLFATQINLITPRGGEQFKTGQSVYIQWFPDTTYNVTARVAVLKEDTIIHEQISKSGMVVWPIPAICQTGLKYKVSVTDLANSANFDQSDSCFYIQQSDSSNPTDSVFNDITENTIWTADTIFVLNNLTIAKNKTLTISEGCTVLFNGENLLTVEGALIANGTVAGKISFDSRDNNYWQGIYFPERTVSDSTISSIFDNCYFRHGKATNVGTGGSMQGNGGVIRAGKGNSIVVVDCEFDEDEAERNGGAIYANNSHLTIINSLFHHNRAGLSGGALYFENCSPQISNNTLIFNQADQSGGGLAFLNSSSDCRNNIIWFNTATIGKQIHLSDDNSDPDFWHCNISGGFADFSGNGSGSFYSGVYLNNIDLNPQIIGKGDKSSFRLLANSPCIDSGINTYENFPLYDIYGNPRVTGSYTDIGAYEYQSGVGIDQIIKQFESQLHNYPNPFNPATTISFQTAQSGFADLKVYNIKGEIVGTLLSKQIEAGSHSVIFNGQNLASGIYLCKLTQSGRSALHKLVLTK